MTRIPGAIWTPATYDPAFPTGKYGYDGYKKTRSLNEILYVVYHDARGYRSYLRQGHRPGDRASWLATVQTDGTILQHYELEHPTWTSGTYQANIDGVAVEHENEVGPWGVPQPWQENDAMVQADAHIFLELRKVCPNLRAPVLGQGFEEHTRLTNGATACPSGRIRWNDIAAIVNGEDDLDEATLRRVVREELEQYKGSVRQLAAEAIDRFMRGQVDEKTQRIAHESTLLDIKTDLKNLTLKNG